MGIGFNSDQKKTVHPLEEIYQGQYVVVTLQGSSSNYTGKFEKVNKGFIILNPHQTGYMDGKNLKLRMSDEPECLSLANLVSIETTTLENIHAYNQVFSRPIGNSSQNQLPSQQSQ